jgi:hypothetical protein
MLGHIILFEHGQLRGDHKHIFNAEPDLNNDEDDSFKSGSFPDPITHDVTITFIFLPDTMALLLETPFDPFDGPSDSTISLVNAGTGNMLPDGTLSLPSVQITVTVSIGVTTVDVADIVFDLTTGHVDSPNNDFHDTGTPRDPATGAIRLVGAGRSNDDDFLVALEGNLVKECRQRQNP